MEQESLILESWEYSKLLKKIKWTEKSYKKISRSCRYNYKDKRNQKLL